MDEHEKLEKIREIRLIVTEVLMFIAVVLLVGFLTLIVMGYSFNISEIGGSGEVVERTGLVQISSIPTGATIAIDGGTPLLLRTNASRTVLSGEHEISLSKDGFDSWSKTVKVTEGMMYRVNYPRIFLENREVEEVLDFSPSETSSGEVTFSSVTPNKEKMLIVRDGEFSVVELNASTPTEKKLELPEGIYGSSGGDSGEVLSAEQTSENSVKKVQKITSIREITWSGNSERLLAKINGEYIVFNLKNPKETVNLSRLLSAGEILDLKFESEAGDKILVLSAEKELLEVNIREGKVSEALLKNVIKFDNDGERILYLTKETVEKEVSSDSSSDSEGGSSPTEVKETETLYKIRAYRIGAEESFEIRLVRNADVEIAVMKYFQEFYFMAVDGNFIKVYTVANWPEKDDAAEKVFEGGVGFAVSELEKRGKGMAFGFEDESGAKKAVFDIEALGVVSFETTGKTGWVDEFLRFEVFEDGKLEVLDYDGLNRRGLVEKGVDYSKAITISGNNRYLYYFSEGKLLRERVN